ncbi:MAG: TetR/AcrR family transcriptional regulator [Clostridium sp.]|nr:TetR/AcrR family transcriptional regulator [Clostridium sp.]
MESLLTSIEREKRNNIINSAMKEFSKNSFQNASTNVIAKEAGISKGLLFHYFGTKERLYKFLEFFSIKVVTDEIVNKMDWNQQDIFLRLKEISLIKFKLLEEYPYLTDFSFVVFQDKTADEIMQIEPGFPLELYSKIYTHNIDFTLFKDNIDQKKAVDIVRWTIEKYGDDFRGRVKTESIEFDYKQIEKEIYSYIDMLKKCFYK